MDFGNRKAARHLLEVPRCFVIDSLGSEPRLSEACRKSHGKAPGVGSSDKFLRIGSRPVLHSRFERKGPVIRGTHLHVTLPFQKISLPFCFCTSNWHVSQSP